MTWRRSIWYVAAGGVTVAALLYAFWPRPIPVDLARVQSGEMTVTINGDGRTRVREIYVVSAPVTGRLMRVERHVGDAVVVGETLLASIQPGDPTFLDRRTRLQAEAAVKAAEAAFSLAEAELQRAKAELNFARSDLDRAEKLAARGTLSQRDLDRAILEEKTRHAAVETAEAMLAMRRFEAETARAALIQPGESQTESESQVCCVNVFAPQSGTVLRVIQESEGVMVAGTPLMEIGDPADLEIVVDLLSRDAVRINEGAAVTIADWGGEGTLSGRVRRVEPYAFTKVSALGIEEQRVNVIIDLTDPHKRWESLGHGFRVNARIVVWRGADVLQVPLGALFREGDDWAVFLANSGRAELRRIEVSRNDGRAAAVASGLDEGDSIILHPGDRISDGVRVISRNSS